MRDRYFPRAYGSLAALLLILVWAAPRSVSGASQGVHTPAQNGQHQASLAAPAASPGSATDDVHSADAIIAALYKTISGPAGKRRDWDRFRSLFFSGARLAAVGRGPQGRPVPQVFTVDEYISRATPVFARTGFYENEIARRSQSYGHIKQVFSSYESRHSPGEKPFERGINAIQLFHDGQRWWLVNVEWEAETAQHPIPEEYLH